MNRILLFNLFYLIGTYCANGCCFPKQTEGNMGLSIGTVTNGKGTAISGMLYYAEDLDRKLMYQSGTIYVNGYPVQGKSLYDYNTGKKYEAAFGGCQVKEIKDKQIKCIPNNAIRIFDTYYGVGDTKIDVEGYHYTDGNSKITLTVEKGNCAVLGLSIQTDNMILNAGFMGVTLGLRNASVIEMPSECKHLL